MRLCVAGDTGLLGQAILRRFAHGNPVLGASTSQSPSSWAATSAFRHLRCDVAKDPTPFFRAMDEFSPELVVNCAALVDVKACEEVPSFAETLNAEWPGRLADKCSRLGARLIHISTDQIFDGRKHAPYTEEDEPAPLNQYGRTKWLGEEAVRKCCPDAAVVRTNIVGLKGAARPTFAEWLISALIRKEKIRLADDFFTSSLHVDYLAEALSTLCKHPVSGTLNLASSDALSKYEFGRLLALELHLDFSSVEKVRLKDLKLVPERPGYLGLDVSKAERLTGTELPRSLKTVKKLAADHRAKQETTRHAYETI